MTKQEIKQWKKKKPILFTAKFLSMSGYGYQAIKYAVAMNQYADIYLNNQAQSDFDRPEAFNQLLLKQPSTKPLVGVYDGNLNGQAHSSTMLDTRYKGYYTMFETDKIALSMVEDVNSYDFCIVPSHFCKEVFEKSGVKVPLYVVPHGVDGDEFRYKARSLKPRAFIFESYGILSPRKGIHLGIEAFLKTFPIEKYTNVLYHIRSVDRKQWWKTPDDYRILDNDNRVLSRASLVEQLHDVQVCLMPSLGEGMGMVGMECMATGMPVIGTNFSGVTEYLNETTGYPVDYKLIPAFGYASQFDGQLGNFGEVDVEKLATTMKYVYDNYDLALVKAKYASQVMRKKLSWEKQGKAMVDAITHFLTSQS